MFYSDNLKIRDEYGRERIFRGINICLKSPAVSGKLIRKHLLKQKLFDDMNSIGVNIVRLGITWAAIEPRENQYNTEIILALKEFVRKCAEQNIYIMLDMHQDLFSYYFHGDGAPEWVINKTYPNKRPYAVWAEGYFYMQGVQKSFYDFWTNKNAIQTKFIKMWKYLASSLSECNNIIGYDYFNEPYVHENGRKVFCSIVSNVMKVAYDKETDFEQCFKNCNDKRGFAKLAIKIFSYVRSENSFKSLLNFMDSKEHFGKAVEGLEQYTEEFNREYYNPFFDEISKTVNAGNKLNFFEHNYYSNLGLPFKIEHKDNDIYSPHAYDVFVDSPLYNKYSSNNRVGYILSAIRKNQLKMKVPVIFGEWGGAAPGQDWLKHIDFVMGEFEKYHWSSIYWGYTFKDNLNQIFNRPYPVAVCGDITEIRTDSENRKFILKWNCEKEFPDGVTTEIYVPEKGIIKYTGRIGENKIEIEY